MRTGELTPSATSSDVAVISSPGAVFASWAAISTPPTESLYVPVPVTLTGPNPANNVAELSAAVAVAVTPVLVLCALIASASARALLVALPVAIALPLIVSDPLLTPPASAVLSRLVPFMP